MTAFGDASGKELSAKNGHSCIDQRYPGTDFGNMSVSVLRLDAQVESQNGNSYLPVFVLRQRERVAVACLI